MTIARDVPVAIRDSTFNVRTGSGARVRLWVRGVRSRTLTNALVSLSLTIMESVSVYDAKTHLSRLLDAVEAGEEIVITRNGHPVARLVRVLPTPKRRFGTLPNVATIRDDFDEPLAIDDLDFVSR